MKIEITEKQMEQIIKFAANKDMDLCIAGAVLVKMGLQLQAELEQKLENSEKNNERIQAETAFLEAAIESPYGIVKC